MDNSYYQSYDTSDNYIVWNTRAVVTLIICIAIPLIVGAVSSLLTKNAMIAFNSMDKPPLSPPAWLFPVVWTILYIAMGISSFLILKSTSEERFTGLMLYVIQLAMNFAWSLIFFRFDAYVLAAVWLGILLAILIALIVNTAKYSFPAMLMLLPYATWCCFALYLNIGIAVKFN